MKAKTGAVCCLLLHSVTAACDSTLPPEPLNPDRTVLVALYEATDGATWANSDGWLSDRPIGEWHGVHVSGGRVVRLDLPYNYIAGPIPPELGDLTRLERLNLRFNNFSGPIPPELGKLAGLKFLDFFDNNLTGPIPLELGNLDSLERLSLDPWNCVPQALLDWLGGRSHNAVLCVTSSSS